MKNQTIYKTFKTEEAARGWMLKNKHRMDPHTVRFYMESGITILGYYEDWVVQFKLSETRMHRVCFNCGGAAKGKRVYGCDVCLDCRKKREEGMSFEEIRKIKRGQ